VIDAEGWRERADACKWIIYWRTTDVEIRSFDALDVWRRRCREVKGR
jgi:hypothetical protein